MTNKEKVALAKDRLHKLEENGKNIGSGVLRKLRRKIKSLS